MNIRTTSSESLQTSAETSHASTSKARKGKSIVAGDSDRIFRTGHIQQAPILEPDWQSVVVEEVANYVRPVAVALQKSPFPQASSEADFVRREMKATLGKVISDAYPESVSPEVASTDLLKACDAFLTYAKLIVSRKKSSPKHGWHQRVVQIWTDRIQGIKSDYTGDAVINSFRSNQPLLQQGQAGFENMVDILFKEYEHYEGYPNKEPILSHARAVTIYEFSYRLDSFTLSRTQKIKQKILRDEFLKKIGVFFRAELDKDNKWPKITREHENPSSAAKNKVTKLFSVITKNPTFAVWNEFQAAIPRAIRRSLDDTTLGRYWMYQNSNTILWQKTVHTMVEAEKKALIGNVQLSNLEIRDNKKKKNVKKEKLPPTEQGQSTLPIDEEKLYIKESEPAGDSENPLEVKLCAALKSRKSGIRFEGEIARKIIDEMPWADLLEMNTIVHRGNITLGEIDLTTQNAIVEVTEQRNGKEKQIMNRLITDKEINPDGKPVILYAPNYTNAAENIIRLAILKAKEDGHTVAAFYLSKETDDLNDILYMLHKM